ncbi:MAG: putative quinol monooxygenase [Desulfuromonadaceae bacterium]|nr:putative quinol monooxygenase [Desulfuromonadaceae bacterium]MDD2846991.1 putative quinol monooxygenase [Desulfuromonadaceae bacterium]MDD4129031.1 putative quinol monooxygenase [Desulfuromonadaceae bacterium]
MSKITVVAKIVAKKDAVETVKSELLKLVPLTREEAGCIEYKLHQDNEEPAVFVFYETWESLVCLENHMNSDHFKNYVNAVGSLIEEKIVHKMTQL